jgi:hypothetical protein
MYSPNLLKHSHEAMNTVVVAVFGLLLSDPSSACPFHRPREIAEVSKSDLVVRGKVVSHTRTRAPLVSGVPRTPDVGTMSLVVTETLRGPIKAEWTIKLIDAGMGLTGEWKNGDEVIVAANREPSDLDPWSVVMRQKPCSDLLVFLDNKDNAALARRVLSSN